VHNSFYEQHHHNKKKPNMFYLNTLAVYAVNLLRMLEVETDWSASDSWHPALQTLANMADLKVKNKGKLECRPVLPEAKTYQVPPEVGLTDWLCGSEARPSVNRGNAPRICTSGSTRGNPFEPAPVSRRVARTPEPNEQPLPVKEPIQLSQWLHKLFDAGWEAESLLEPPQAEFAFSYRSLSQTVTSTLENADTGVKRGKRLDLEREGEQVLYVLNSNLLPHQN
jgi:hypothetical protein